MAGTVSKKRGGGKGAKRVARKASAKPHTTKKRKARIKRAAPVRRAATRRQSVSPAAMTASRPGWSSPVCAR